MLRVSKKNYARSELIKTQKGMWAMLRPHIWILQANLTISSTNSLICIAACVAYSVVLNETLGRQTGFLQLPLGKLSCIDPVLRGRTIYGRSRAYLDITSDIYIKSQKKVIRYIYIFVLSYKLTQKEDDVGNKQYIHSLFKWTNMWTHWHTMMILQFLNEILMVDWAFN